jgi:hypothetical protein
MQGGTSQACGDGCGNDQDSEVKVIPKGAEWVVVCCFIEAALENS